MPEQIGEQGSEIEPVNSVLTIDDQSEPGSWADALRFPPFDEALRNGFLDWAKPEFS